MFVRSALPGSGLGYVWHGPGDVVEMPEEHAAELCAIEPDRFTSFVDDPREPSETGADSKTPAKKAAARGKAVTE